MGDAPGLPGAAARREQCLAIASEAGDLLRARFGDPGEIREKGLPDDTDRMWDVVTEVDYLSEQLVLGRIAEVNPDAVVLAEEGGLVLANGTPMADADRPIEVADAAEVEELWLVDPLDGTVNFAHGVPHFCVSVACWRRGEPVAGAIVDPMVGETFSFQWAEGGEPAAAFHGEQRVHLDVGPSPEHAMISVGSGGRSLVPIIRRFRSWRRLGSAALALAWVGVGRCGAYVQPGMLNPWDWAAGAPFVVAAGGVVTDAQGPLWPTRLLGTTGIVAAPRAIHDEIAGPAAEAAAERLSS